MEPLTEEPGDRAHRIDDELSAISYRLKALQQRLDAFQPWDHEASAERLTAIDRAAQERQAEGTQPPEVV